MQNMAGTADGTNLSSLGVEIVVADDCDVETVRERVLQRPDALQLRGEGEGALER